MTTQSNGQSLMVQGRLVWVLGSNMFEGNVKKDMNTKQELLDNNGNKIIEYGFGLAIPKINPQTNQNHEEFVKTWQTLHQEALSIYPSGQLPQGFAMKFKDGDKDVDQKGVPYSKREGYAGHMVLTCTTRIPIKYFKHMSGNNVLVNEGFKNGDYVNVQLNVKVHPAVGTYKAGLYLNPGAVQLIQEGKEIINTPSGDQIFGQNMPAYNGNVEAPTVPNMAQAMGAPVNAPTEYPAQEQPAANPAMPPMGAPSQQAPVADPHYGVLPATHQPVPQASPAMPAQQFAPQANTTMPGMPS